MTVYKLFWAMPLLMCSSAVYPTQSIQTTDWHSLERVGHHNDRKKQLMIDLTQQKELRRWRITNDGVMGGLSKGRMQFDSDHGVFSGYISTDNNGGFSSVFRPITPLSEETDSISIDIEGDGQLYQLRMVAYVDGFRLMYKQEFQTTAGSRQRLQFSLTDFQATFRGRIITNAPPLTAGLITETGFLMTKKAAGKFFLRVYKMSFFAQEKLQSA